jgi:hypothetical protein
MWQVQGEACLFVIIHTVILEDEEEYAEYEAEVLYMCHPETPTYAFSPKCHSRIPK